MADEEVNKPSSLASYPEMILAAIEALNSPNGSNKSTISKYIESKYGRLPAGHSTFLSHHLNKLKDTGELIFWKNNYFKNGPNAPLRRGRGRPPKDPLAPPSSVPKVAKNEGPSSVGSGRPRGRPRKMEGESKATSGRPRGRPPKVKPTFTEGSLE